MPGKSKLTIPILLDEAAQFAEVETTYDEPSLFGTTDGKAIGTYLEHKFTEYLAGKYSYEKGNSASGIDLPSLLVDVKVTSIKQPQSSSPFKSARQKIYGLGYNLLVFVYDKKDDHKGKTARLNMKHTIFVEAERTADFQTTNGIRQILANKGNSDDIFAFIVDRNLPVDEVGARALADEVMRDKPVLGYLTMSNALQWRLQYSRVIDEAGHISGIHRIR